MNKKRCNKCGEIKPVSEFGKESRAKNGYKCRCKTCTNSQYNKDYHKYRKKKLATAKLYYLKNYDDIKEKSKEYFKKQDREQRIITKTKWRENNRLKIRTKHNRYMKERIKIDPVFKANRIMRTMVNRLIKDKTEKTSKLLGYSAIDLINSLGSDISIMHIDHKVPVSWFIPGTDIKIINSLENLHLLTESENVKKHNCFAHSISKDYSLTIMPYIKTEYINLIKLL